MTVSSSGICLAMWVRQKLFWGRVRPCSKINTIRNIIPDFARVFTVLLLTATKGGRIKQDNPATKCLGRFGIQIFYKLLFDNKTVRENRVCPLVTPLCPAPLVPLLPSWFLPLWWLAIIEMVC